MMKQIALFLMVLIPFVSLAQNGAITVSDFETSGNFYQLVSDGQGEMQDFVQAMADEYAFILGWDGTAGLSYNYPSSTSVSALSTNRYLYEYIEPAQTMIINGFLGSYRYVRFADVNSEWQAFIGLSKYIEPFVLAQDAFNYDFVSVSAFRAATNWPSTYAYSDPAFFYRPMISGHYLGPWLWADLLRLAKQIEYVEVNNNQGRPDWLVNVDIISAVENIYLTNNPPVSIAYGWGTNQWSSGVGVRSIQFGGPYGSGNIYYPNDPAFLGNTNYNPHDLSRFVDWANDQDDSPTSGWAAEQYSESKSHFDDYFTNPTNYTSSSWGERFSITVDANAKIGHIPGDGETLITNALVGAIGTHAFARISMEEKSGFSLAGTTAPYMQWTEGRVYTQGGSQFVFSPSASYPSTGGEVGTISIIDNVNGFGDGHTTTNLYIPFGQYENPMNRIDGLVDLLSADVTSFSQSDYQPYQGIVIKQDPRINIID